MKRILSALFLMTAFVLPSRAQLLTNACESDPCKALPVCGNTTYTVAPSYTSSVASNPIGTCSGISPAGTTFAYASNWMYVRFTCTTTGSLVFTLTALDAAADLNWALWDITTTGCSSLGVGNLVECNSRGAGATGTQVGAAVNSLFQNPPTITAGSTYILGVSRASGGTVTTGFTINFTGSTASLLDNTGPALSSVLPFNTCDAVDTIKIKMTEKIRCNQLSVGDFTVSTNPTYTVGSSSCPGCTTPTAGINYSNVTDTIIMGFPTALAPGTYTISLTANGFTDICGNFSNTGPTVTFTVPKRLKDSIRTGFDCSIQKYIDTVYAVGGSSPYQYKAVGSGQSGLYGASTPSYNVFTNISGGQNYTFTARDANLCTADTVVNHPAYSSINLITFKVDVPCNGQYTGDTIKVLSTSGGAPPYQYSLSGPGAPGGTTAIPIWSNLVFPGGGATYTITAIDAYSCTKTVTINLINPPVLNCGTTGTNLQCFGACNGTVTAIASGGTPTYAYSIAPTNVGSCIATQAANVFSTLGAASYTVTCSDLKGCTKTAVRTITSPTQIIINFNTVVNPTCPNPCSGSFIPTSPAASGTGSKKYYLYDPTGTFFQDSCITAGCSFTGLCQGTYTVMAKDAAGCTITNTVTLSLPPIPDIVLDSVTNVLCNGGCSGKIYTTTTGGTTPYAYTFTPLNNAPCGNAVGFGTGDFQNLPVGANYKIVVTSPNQCKDSILSIAITQPPVLSWNSLTKTDLLCFQGCDGTINALAQGGTPPYTYQISANNAACTTTQVNPGQFGNLAAQTFTVTATDANNCSITSTITLSQPPQLVLNHIVNQTVSCNGGCDASVTINPTGGTGAITNYQISPILPCAPGQAVAGTFTGLGPNTYTVTAQDANGCTASTTFTIANPPVLSITANVTGNVSCFGLCDGSASTNTTGGTPGYSYSIAGPGTPVISVVGVASGLCNGVYTITVTDSKFCTATSTVQVTQPNLLTINASGLLMVSCGGLCDGGANMNSNGGTGSVTYTIQSPAGSLCTPTQTIPGIFGGLGAGTYTVTGTDVNTCAATTTFTITEPSQLFVNAVVNNNVSCFGGCNGTATASFSGGSGGVTYTISPNVPCVPTQAVSGTFTNLGANTYTITGTDINGCSATTVITVTQPAAAFTVSVTSTNDVSCAGGCDGAAVITGNGGTTNYTFSISPNSSPCGVPTQTTSGSFGNLASGSYTVTGLDAQGCTATTVFTINEPAVLITSVNSSTLPTCSPGCDGTATMNSVGGNGGYVYSVNPVATVTGNVISGLCAGITYTITSTDTKGCSGTTTVSLTTPNAPVVSAVPGSVTDVSCFGVCDAAAQFTASSGTPPYTYSIAGPGSPIIDPQTGAATSLCAGNYVVTVTDAAFCVGTIAITINGPSQIIPSAVLTNANCFGVCDGTATMSSVGGNGGYGYSIAPAGPTVVGNLISGLCANTVYTVTSTDINGCSGTTTISITQPTLVQVSVTGSTNVSCNGGCDGTVTVSGSGGTGAITYSIAPGAPCVPAQVVSGTFTNLGANTYTITAIDVNGCSATTTITITEPPLFSLTVTATQDVGCAGGCDGTASVIGNGGTPNYTYTISPSVPCLPTQVTAGNFGNLGANTYTVQGTDANGCTATITFTINEPGILITNVVSSTPPSCQPGCDGTATMTSVGGNGGYVYTVNPVATVTGNVISGLCAGITYTITSTDTKGCSGTSTVSLTTPNAPVVSAVPGSVTDVSCFGVCDAEAQFTASSGTPPYTYSIAGPGSPIIDPQTGAATSLCAGNYVVTVTDAAFCVGTIAITINGPSQIIPSAVLTNANCFGVCDGTATMSSVGGNGGYGYSIAPAGPTVVGNLISGLCANTVYTVTSTDINGCSGTTTISITQPTLVQVSVTGSTNVSCNGGCDGTVTVSGSGGTGAITYSIAPGAPCVPAQVVSGTFTNLGANTYTITAIDVNGCSATTTITITEPPLFSLTVTATQDVGCAGGCDGTASVIGNGGTPNYTYTISPSVPCLPTQVTAGNFGNLGANTYTVQGTDANGCTATITFTINEPGILITNVVSSTSPSCQPGCDGTATMTSVGGNGGYVYSVNPVATVTGNVISGLCAGITYTITSTDTKGCSGTSTVSLTTPNAPVVSAVPGSVTDVSCFGVCDAEAQFTASSGTPPYTYSIAGPGSPIIDPQTGAATSLCAGNYVVTVTDAAFCVGTIAITINGPSQIIPSAVLTNANCFGVCDGTATMSSVGGNGGYGYSIAPAGPTVVGNLISGLCANTVYTVTSTDINGCSGTTTISITQPTLVQVSVTGSTNVSCNGGCDGTVTVSGSGGTGAITYSIAPGAPCVPAQVVSGTFTNLGANTYTITAIDVNGCSATTTITITEPPVFSLTVTATQDVGCAGGCDGTASVIGNGGTPNYTYTISPSVPCLPTQVTAGNFGNLGANTYTVQGTDANGCTATITFTINEPGILITNVVSSTPPSCQPGCDGTATMTSVGGNGGYVYSVNPVATVTGNVISGLCAGITYTITSTDTKGCSGTSTVSLTTPNAPVVSAVPGSVTDVSCFGVCDAAAQFTASSGTPPYTYSIAGPGSPIIDPQTGAATSLCAGNYVVTVTDAAFCVGTIAITINGPSQIIPSAVLTNANCFGVCDGTATMSSVGGNGGYGYSIAPAGPTVVGNLISGLCANTVYTVTSTDINGCSGTTTISITQPTLVQVSVTGSTNVSCNGGCDGTVTVSGSGGTGAITYSIAPGAPCVPAQVVSGTFTNLGANTYTITAIDVNGCSATTTITITEPPVFSLSVTATQDVSCAGGCDGTASVIGNGGTPNYTYTISPSVPCLPTQVTAGNFGNLGANTYTVQGTDANGCTATITFTINEPGILIPSVASSTSPSCQPGCDGTATMTSVGGNGGYVYSVNPAATVTGNVISGLCANTAYTITSTDTKGCTGTTTISLTTPNSPVLSITSTVNPSCAPGCDGTANFTITGGTAPYNASISGAASVSLSPNVASNLCNAVLYTITVTDVNQCQGTTTVQLNQPSGPVISVTAQTDASCAPGCDGTATLSPAAGIVYSINPAVAPGFAGNVVTGLCANTVYTITGTDANGCTGTTTVQVGTANGPGVSIVSTTDASCSPGCDGSATFNPTGGASGYTYSINPSGTASFTGNTVNGLCANIIYTVTLSDANACSTTIMVSVNVASGPQPDTLSTTAAGCNPSCNGTATMTPVNLTYTVSPAAGAIVGNVINGLCAGVTYTVTGTDANGCTNTMSFQIGTTPNPTLNVTAVTNVSTNGGNNGSITVTAAGGTAPYMSYTITPAIGTQAPAGNFTGLTAQCYTIVVTDSKGCTASTSTCLSEPGACSLNISNQVNVNCFGQATGSFVATASGGSGSFNYSILPSGTINATTGVASNLTVGTYTVTAADNLPQGCVVTSVVVITQNPNIQFNAPTVVAPTCVPGCDGGLTISATGGSGGMSYSINNATIPCQVTQTATGVFNGLGNAIYTVTVTDGLGCTKTTTIAVAPPTGPSFTNVNKQNVTCNGLCNGSAVMVISGGSAPISYTISPNAPCVPVQAVSGNFTGLGANTYTVVATDANGCTATTSFVITQPPALLINTFNTTDPACNGNSNGTASIIVSGGTGAAYNYQINPAAPGAGGNFTGLSGGVTYTITVSDVNLCSISTVFTLNNPTSLSWVNFNYTDIVCAGQNNGTISACVQGGTGIISYTLNGAPIANCNITNLSANTYTVVATDGAGCFLSTVVTIVEPPLLVMSSPSPSPALCFGQSSGSITTSAIGGTPGVAGYTFSITPAVVPPNNTGFFNNLPAGNYVVTVTDSLGCTASFSNIQVTQPPAIQITAVNVQNVACYGQATGSITITSQGGTGTIDYTINPPANQTSTGFFTGLPAGNYVITATDDNGCSLQTTVSVTQNPQIVTASLTLTEPICNGDANGIINISATGGFPPIEYALDGPPFQNTGLFNAVLAGPHTITFRDLLGCTKDTIVVLTEPLPVGATVQLRDANCIDSEDGQALVQGTGGRGGYKYYVTPGLYINKSGVFNGLAAGTYTLRVVDTAGCEYFTLFTINPPANPLNNTVTKLDLGCHGKGNEGQATANVSGGTAPYTYLWSTEPPQTTATAQTLYFGTYYVDVTDANGCQERDTVYIEEGPCCDIAFIPNAFSPNGDGSNDEFKVMTTAGVILIQLEVRDRWGKKVWSTNDYRRGWDGTFEGRDSSVDTYYYILRYTCTRDGKTYTKKGDVTLIR